MRDAAVRFGISDLYIWACALGTEKWWGLYGPTSGAERPICCRRLRLLSDRAAPRSQSTEGHLVPSMLRITPSSKWLDGGGFRLEVRPREAARHFLDSRAVSRGITRFGFAASSGLPITTEIGFLFGFRSSAVGCSYALRTGQPRKHKQLRSGP